MRQYSFPKAFSGKFSVRLMIVLVLILLTLVIFWFIIHEVIYEKEETIDRAIINFVADYRTAQLTPFMEAMTFLASKYFLIPAYLILISWFLFHQKKKIVALNVAITGTIGFCLVFILKNIFQRNRPLNPVIEPLDDYSFPSGHTTSGFIFYGLLIYLAWQSKLSNPFKFLLSLLLLLTALLIGLSRIYLGMHYPSDVVAGFCLGFIWLTTALLLLHYLNKTASFKGLRKV